VRRVLVACVSLSALSLLLPSEPSYDPWAWIVWGRELVTLDLDTSGGPSWKPLPVVFTAIFAPFGALSDGVPPALWLVVARTGTLLALALAFRLAYRLAGPRRTAGLLAGTVAAIALALTPDWLRYAAHGNEVPLAIALLLWAVNRALDENHRGALLLGFAACLLRPEAFPFVAAHGIWVFRRDPDLRRLIGGLAAALPILWLGPEWIGSRRPFDAGDQARSEPVWSLSLTDDPWLSALERVHEIVGLPLEIGTLAALGLAVRGPSDRRQMVVLTLVAAAASWVILVAAMTEAGFSGSPRYFMPAVTLACVLTGVGVSGLVGLAGGRGGLRLGSERLRPPPTVRGAAAIAAGLLAVAATPWVGDRAEGLGDQARGADRLAGLERGLSEAVADAGGPEPIVAVGAPRVGRQFQTRLAWETRLTLGEVERANGAGLRFRASPGPRVPAVGSRSLCTRLAGNAWCVTSGRGERGRSRRGGAS